MNMTKYFEQLIGFKIIGFQVKADEFGGKAFPVYTLEKDGVKVNATVSKDAEGNGGGFIFLEESKRR